VTLSSFSQYFCGKIFLKVNYNSNYVVVLNVTIVYSIDRGRRKTNSVCGVPPTLKLNIKWAKSKYFSFMTTLTFWPTLTSVMSSKTIFGHCLDHVACIDSSKVVRQLHLVELTNKAKFSEITYYYVEANTCTSLFHILGSRRGLAVGNRNRQDVHRKYCVNRTNMAKSIELMHDNAITHAYTLLLHISSSIWAPGAVTRDLLVLCGDVELNPGPTGKLLVGTYNTSGCKKYSKLKRLMTWLFKHKKADRFIFSLQETHLSNNELPLVQSLWREGIILSPSNGRARGVLTLFSNNLFENLIHGYGTSDGRMTIVIGSYNGVIEMFISLYSPNSGKNAEFYSSFFSKVNNLVAKYDVDNIYVSGDFNLVLDGAVSSNRLQSFYERKLVKIVSSEMELLNLNALSDLCKCTWNRGDKFSTLDYVFGPKSISNGKCHSRTLWALDKSDHAAIIVTIEFDLDKGRGMLRPNLSFLDCVELRSTFEAELFLLIEQTDSSWDPHTKLEYTKVAIRSKVIEYSLKHRKKVEDKHSRIMTDIEKAKSIKLSLMTNSNHPLHRFLSCEQVDRDMDVLHFELDEILAEKTKILSAKSRIKWLEAGEKSNKYFLNLNKSFHNSSYFKSFLSRGEEVQDSDSKIKAVYDFYASLYTNSVNENCDDFLDTLPFRQISHEDCSLLTKPLTIDEITKVLKSCGDTACGPDGIGYRLLKTCWSFYSKILLDSWCFGIQTGILAPSHRESVICLLKKKGKDHRVIGNLRPITLSNCDIKLISKALTKRCNPILHKVLDPHQTAYIPGRIVHDNLRTIDIIKDECSKRKRDGFLVSLDAKKAFDSVDHCFIKRVLACFNFPNEFISTFELLYNQIQSRVIVNGFLTDAFPILRSVKQGDALSCVLFILCMETVIKTIQNDALISPIKFDGLAMPKVLAYADDIAVIVADSHSIYECIKAYSLFSKVSGLYLNVEKTEVLALNPESTCNSIAVPSPSGDTTLDCIQKLTICGRTFSLDPDIEREANVDCKINNMIRALASWSKRSLSIFGRNLLLKTFGMSQLIYSMQNTYFDARAIKMIESISHNFLWCKKADKTKAYERISRIKLKQPTSAGGISSPDACTMSKALMVKQLIRSSSVHNGHSINYIQTNLSGYNPLILFQSKNVKSSNLFLLKSVNVLEELGNTIINEILNSSEDAKLNKDYYDLIASENALNLIGKLSRNPITFLQAKQAIKTLGISTVGQLINEYKFPRTDRYCQHVHNVVMECKLLDILAKRKHLSYGTTYREKFFLTTNSPISEIQFSTKLLRHCLFKSQIIPPNGLTTSFLAIAKITHPKEREVAFFKAHDVILCNEKLFNMKLISSPDCLVCNEIQTTYHIFYSCFNALRASDVLADFKHLLESNPALNANINSLVNRLLYINRNRKVTSDLFIIAINNRLEDLKVIALNKERNKNLSDINKLSLI
jgi:hypothetical protein